MRSDPEKGFPVAVDRPPKVTICIATFRRPDGLKRLLASIGAQEFDGTVPDIAIIVIDNDAAHPLGGGIRVQDWCKYPVTYLVEPQRGLSAVRNRALNAVSAGTDFIAFVDDDEEASPNWLAELLRTQSRFDAAAVQGPVVPRFETPPPDWIRDGGYFELGPYTDGQPLMFAGTNNSLVSWALVESSGLRFDMRFNLTGGEDQDFFVRLRLDHGGRIVASGKAVVFDEVPASRMTGKWVLRRWFRIGNTLGRIAVMRRRDRLLRFAKALAKLARGLVRATIGSVSSQTRVMAGLAEMAWGIGTLFAYFHIKYDEYGEPSYRGAPDVSG